MLTEEQDWLAARKSGEAEIVQIGAALGAIARRVVPARLHHEHEHEIVPAIGSWLPGDPAGRAALAL